MIAWLASRNARSAKDVLSALELGADCATQCFDVQTRGHQPCDRALDVLDFPAQIDLHVTEVGVDVGLDNADFDVEVATDSPNPWFGDLVCVCGKVHQHGGHIELNCTSRLL